MGHAGAARAAHGRAGLPALLGRRGLPAHARSARRLWSRARPLVMRGEEQGRAELNGARERVGLPPLDARARRDLARAGDRGDLPAARVPAQRRLAVAAGDRAAAVGAAVRRGRAAARRRAARAGGAEHVAGPGAAAAAGGARGAGGRAGAGAGHAQPARRPPRRSTVPANARLVDWVSYARTMPLLRRRGLPRRPRHGGAGAGERRAGGGVPATRATWPRTRPGSAGPASGVSLPRRFHDAARRAPGGAPPARRPELRRRAEELRDWAAAQRRRAAPRPPTPSRSSPKALARPQKSAKSGVM